MRVFLSISGKTAHRPLKRKTFRAFTTPGSEQAPSRHTDTHRLLLLRSRPDKVHEALLRETQLVITTCGMLPKHPPPRGPASSLL